MGYFKNLLIRDLFDLERTLKSMEAKDIEKEKTLIKCKIAKIKGILESFSDEM